MTIINDLFRFAFCGTKEQWYNKLDQLAQLSLPETWSYRTPNPNASNQRTPILENYILHTFKRLAYEYNSAKDRCDADEIFSVVGDKLCFNTGLFTTTYETIYAGLKKNQSKDKEPWYLMCFSDTSDPFFRDFIKLPRRAKYFSKISELIYDTNADLRVNTAHILQNEKNRERLPETIKDSPWGTLRKEGAPRRLLYLN